MWQEHNTDLHETLQGKDEEVKGDTFTVPSWERQSLHILSRSMGSTEASPQVVSDQVLAGCAHWIFQQKFPFPKPSCSKGSSD